MAEIGTDIKKAVDILNNGGLVGIPTDTLYGLAANGLDEAAVKSVFDMKQRPLDKALIFQIGSVDKLDMFCKSVPAAAKKLAEHFWPGALTLVLEKTDLVPAIVTAQNDTIGVRIPNHPMTLELLNLISYPIVVPSANLSGLKNPTTSQEVNEQLGGIPYILDGGSCAVGIASTIVGFKGEEIVIFREGTISEQEIHEALNR